MQLTPGTQPAESWFALCVTTGHERKVAELLKQKKYQQLVPLYRVRRRWSDRIKELEVPLFPSYVFCRFEASRRMPVLTTPYVRSIVSYGNAPASVEAEEIRRLQLLMHSGVNAQPWPYLEVGDKVRVEGGPLNGCEGILQKIKDREHLVLSVALLQRSVSVEIDGACVTLLDRSNT